MTDGGCLDSEEIGNATTTQEQNMLAFNVALYVLSSEHAVRPLTN